MPRQQAAGVGESLHDLEHARRNSRLEQDLLQLDGGKRRQLRRFEYHGIAAGKGRCGFPTGDLQRVIPGADAGDHAERLASGVAEGLRAEIDMLAAHALHEAGKVFEAVRAGGDVHDARLLNGLAGIARFQLGELLIARPQDVGGAAQHARAFGARHCAPTRLRLLRGAHRRVDLARSGCRDVAQDLAGRGIDGSEAFAGRGAGIARLRGRAVAARGGRRLLQPFIDERRKQCTRAFTVGLVPPGQRGPQPDAVDHRRNHGGEPLRLVRGEPGFSASCADSTRCVADTPTAPFSRTARAAPDPRTQATQSRYAVRTLRARDSRRSPLGCARAACSLGVSARAHDCPHASPTSGRPRRASRPCRRSNEQPSPARRRRASLFVRASCPRSQVPLGYRW